MDTKKRVGIGIAALAVAVLAIGLGTFAAFNDTETGPGGSTAAGTLDLTVGSTNASQLFGQANIAPGFSQQVGVTLHNAGSLPGTLTSKLTASTADVSCTEPEQEAEGGTTCAAAGNLQDQMTVQVISAPGVTAPQAAVPWKTFVANGLPAAGVVPAGGDAAYQLLFALPASADNKVQGDSVTLTSAFTLAQ